MERTIFRVLQKLEEAYHEEEETQPEQEGIDIISGFQDESSFWKYKRNIVRVAG